MTNDMKKIEYLGGIRAAMPIGPGYLAIMIAIGIQARAVGMSVGYVLAFSVANLTSAGEIEAIKVIGEKGTYLAIFVVTLVINLRYVLMAASIAPRVAHLPLYQKMIIAYGLTDEMYAISVMRRKDLTVWFTLGMYTVTISMWTIGTIIGALLGEMLPTVVVLSLQVCLFATFMAIVLPPTKTQKNIRLAVILSMALNGFIELLKRTTNASFFTDIEHYRVIIVVVAVSTLLAIIAPCPRESVYA